MVEIGPNLLKAVEAMTALGMIGVFAFLMYKIVTRD
jgi:hypothetical protein